MRMYKSVLKPMVVGILVFGLVAPAMALFDNKFEK